MTPIRIKNSSNILETVAIAYDAKSKFLGVSFNSLN